MLNTVPEKTLHDLEWRRLLDFLARRCSSDLAAEQCHALPFLDDGEARGRLGLIAELAACINDGDPAPSLPARATDNWLDIIRGHGAAPAEALCDIAANLKLYSAIARYLENRRDLCADNADEVIPPDGSISPMGLVRLAAEIESSFEPDGTIADGASPELQQLRQKVVSLRKHLVSQVEKIAEAEDDLLRERTVTMRNDRFVLPVRADAHRRFSGIVHGASGSGATVFIEPEAVVQLGNELMLARENVLREEARILAALSDAVREQLDEVLFASAIIVTLDARIAAAKLTVELGASVPQAAAPGVVDLKQARHPLLLLDGVKVVPASVRLAPGQAMVISGPNAGGKTVVLKTVGLLGLMLKAGLPIPADPDSCMGLAGQVLTDIGDDQSLEHNLSTFSAHLTNIRSILQHADQGTIVCLDELAAGTDPDEGAALAEAILEQLNDNRATTMGTTHFESLKGRAQTTDGFINAAVGFDAATLQPTFELRIGTPGSSSALAVAARFGIPQGVLARAKGILPDRVRELNAAVEALDKERRAIVIERQSLSEQRQQAERESRRHRDEVTRLRAKQDKLIDAEARELWQGIRRAREKVHQAEATIRRRRTDAKVVSAARKTINEVADQLDPGGELSRQSTQAPPGRPATEADLTPGRKVFVAAFKQHGTVDCALKGRQVQVHIGKVKTRVDLKDLRVLEDKRVKRPSWDLPPEAPPVTSVDATDPLKTSDNTVDLRGMMSDEAVQATDAFLDNALQSGQAAIFVLHGHGTGALRNAVRAYLKQSYYVEDFRPGKREEGGDGITVVRLR